MTFGGVDPSILRELSGVYKPFVKAFKELISNAFDADAENVTVRFAEDFSSVTVTDDGFGMTPFEFRNDFTRIGGSSRRWAGDRTRKGRLRIGNKGIGFLALARYCGLLEVESRAERSFRHSLTVATPTTVDLGSVLGVPISHDVLSRRLSVSVVRVRNRSGPLEHPRHFKLDLSAMKIIFNRAVGPVRINIRVDCRALRFRAALDFDRLLRLADKVDLERVNEFAVVDVFEQPRNRLTRGTRIVGSNLKDFVRRELRSGGRKGYVRNVASRSGLEQFIWLSGSVRKFV